jgi:hypothetical protein
VIAWLACAPAPREVAFVGPGAPVRPADRDQHHAVVTAGPGDEALVAFRDADRVVVVPLAGGIPGAAALPFGDEDAHHPALARTRDGAVLVAASAAGLRTALLTTDGHPRATGTVGGGTLLHPDVAVGPGGGLILWGLGPGGLAGWSFADDPADGAPTAPIPLTWDGAATPAVRPSGDAFVAVWAERGVDGSGVRRAVLDAEGDPRGPSEVVARWERYDDDARPMLAVGDAGEAVAWRRRAGDGAVLATRAAPDGGWTRSPLAGPAGRPALDVAGDVVVVAWERRRDAWEVVLRPFDLATGAPRGPLAVAAADTGIPGRPSVALSDGADGPAGVVSWEAAGPAGREVWARAFRLDEVR